jgi:RNA polymerase sigma factor (sigma-70 family)
VINAIEPRELPALLGTLSDRERMIVQARFGLNGKEESLREVAGRLGISGERVRQIEQSALGKLAAAWESADTDAIAA